MRFTTFTDYSLRVLMHVATAPGGRTTIAEVAGAFDISENHLVKVVHLLGKAGFLANTRGHGGGLRLAAAPCAINIGRVVRATEGSLAPVECFQPGTPCCAVVDACRLAGVLQQAIGAFYAVLDAHTLEDLVADRARLAAILHAQPQPLRKFNLTGRKMP